jgi:uncharacterized protein
LIKKIKKSDYINKLLEKYNIPKEYTSLEKKMLSRGVFLGLFIAMIPMPAQMLAVLAFTFIGKFNFPVAIAMCWITNPFTMPFIYFIEYKTGAFLLGIDSVHVELTIQWFEHNLESILLPLYFGAFFYSLVLSGMAYYGINLYWRGKLYYLKRSRK